MPELDPDSIDRLTGRGVETAWPRAITLPGDGGKFAPDGAALPFPGNTVLCHIDPASDAGRALVEMQERCKAADWASSFAFLPPASFHMTVFDGICMNQAARDDWPADAPADASRDEVTRLMLDRLLGVYLPSRERVRPVAIRYRAGIGISLVGADAENETLVRATRETLSQALGYRPAHFETYRLHITLAYLLHWLTEEQAQRVGAHLEAEMKSFICSVPEIELGPPEF